MQCVWGRVHRGCGAVAIQRVSRGYVARKRAKSQRRRRGGGSTERREGAPERHSERRFPDATAAAKSPASSSSGGDEELRRQLAELKEKLAIQERMIADGQRELKHKDTQITLGSIPLSTKQSLGFLFSLVMTGSLRAIRNIMIENGAERVYVAAPESASLRSERRRRGRRFARLGVCCGCVAWCGVDGFAGTAATRWVGRSSTSPRSAAAQTWWR